MGQVSIHAHFFEQATINNPRSGEYNACPVSAEKYLFIDTLIKTEGGTRGILKKIEELKVYGDAWNDHFRSLNNLVHQLHSIQISYAQAVKSGADIVAFIRPDLNYHDDLSLVFRKAVSHHRLGRSSIFTPDWQRWGGVNDRFAIAVGQKAAMAYGSRIEFAKKFCEESGCPLHSEKLLAFALIERRVKVFCIPHRASRVRANQVQSWEDFDHHFVKVIGNNIKKVRPKILGKMLFGLHKAMAYVLCRNRYIKIDPPNGVSRRSKKEEITLRKRSQSHFHG